MVRTARGDQGLGEPRLRDGCAFGGGKICQTGVFRGKQAMLSLTTGGPEQAYVKGCFHGDMAGIPRPIEVGRY